MAVEFVHPVIMGKRALPSVALVDPDPVAQARVATRPGDVILAVASADDPQVRDTMRRAPAWGAHTIWIGFGPRPAAGSADHVLWVESDDPMVPATGRFVLMYHLLWELTHVCFEHPGLLTVTAEECADEVCVTCSDEGRLGEVVQPPAARVRTGAGPHRHRRGGGRRHPGRRGRARRPGAGARRLGHHPRRRDDGGVPMSELNQNTDFLYPFIEGSEDDPDSLLVDLAASARGKAEISARLQQESLDEYEAELQVAGAEMADRFARGRPALHVRQRRELHRRGHPGLAVLPARPAAARCRPGRWPPTRRW